MARPELLALRESTCSACGETIEVKTPIRQWEKQWRHLECALKEIERVRNGRS